MLFKNNYIITNELDNKYKKDLINLYHKYYILLNGLDKMDIFLKLTKSNIDDYINKDIYEYAINYKSALDKVNKLNDNDYLLEIRNNKLISIAKINKNKKELHIDEIISNSNYQSILNYILKYSKNNNVKRIIINIPKNNIKLLIKLSKNGYNETNIIEDNYYNMSKDI